MRDPQRGEEAEQDQADDVVFVELGHAALFHGQSGLRTQAPQLRKPVVNAGRIICRAASCRGWDSASAVRAPKAVSRVVRRLAPAESECWQAHFLPTPGSARPTNR